MTAKMLLLAAILGLAGAASEDCVSDACLADSDDSSLLAHRSVMSSRGRKCDKETGDKVQYDATLPSFTQLDVAGDFEVSFDKGDAQSVKVRVDSGLNRYVNLSVTDSVLFISFNPNMTCTDIDETPKISITSPTFLKSIAASTDAQVQFPGWPFKLGPEIDATTDGLSLMASLDAQIDVKKLNATSIHVIAKDEGKVDLQWTTAETVTIVASSDGRVEGGSTKTLMVDASSDAEVVFKVTGSATGSVTSGAKFKYEGGGDVSNVTTSDGGRVKYYEDE